MQIEGLTPRGWLYGWWICARAIYLARTKKRGAGAMKWRYAIRLGMQYRWIVYGQHRGHRSIWRIM